MRVVSADAQVQCKRRDASDNHDDDDAISVADAYSTLKHDKQWRRMSVHIVAATMYFALFLAMIFSHIPATSTMYELGSSVSSTLAPSGADTLTPDSSMKFSNIQTISDTFDWLTDTFVPSVFVTTDYNGNILTKDKWGRVALFNKVLGGVVFNTTRAQIHPCQAEQFLVDLYPNCYDPDTVTIESVLISFDTNASEATNAIRRLKARGDWLDFATQSLTITVVMYNGELQAYAVTELSLTFHQGGSVEPAFSTTPALSDPYKENSAAVLDVLVGLSSLVLAYHIGVGLVRRVRHEHAAHIRVRAHEQSARARREYLHLVVHELLRSEVYCIGLTILFYAVWFRIIMFMYDNTFRDNLARLVVSGKKFDVNSAERNGLIAVTASLKDIAVLTTVLRVIAVVAILLLGVTVLQKFHAHPQLGVLTRTIASALSQFSSVFIVFVIVFVTFSTAGTVLFGDRVEEFSSLDKSLETCVNMLFGSFDYTTIQDVFVPAPMLFYWSYMIIVSLVLLNMMLAIVLDAYAEVSAAKTQAVTNKSMTRMVDGLLWDLMHARLLWLKRSGSNNAQSRRSLRALLAQPDPRSPPLHVLTLSRDLVTDDVVSRGRINPHILRKVLRGLHKAQSSEHSSDTGNGPSVELIPRTVVTAKTLQEWFAGAQISDAVAQATMAHIRDGMSCIDETASAGAAPADPIRRDRVIKSKANTPRSGAAATPEVIVADASQQSSAPTSGAQEQVCAITGGATVSAQVTFLLQQMEAMQQKLDILLCKLPSK